MGGKESKKEREGGLEGMEQGEDGREGRNATDLQEFSIEQVVENQQPCCSPQKSFRSRDSSVPIFFPLRPRWVGNPCCQAHGG